MEKTSIMVVDDEPYIRRSLSYVLKQEKYSVLSLEDGQLAWEKLISGFIPDIIFLDVMMPRLSGFDLCKLIKSDYRFKDIYVIMLTARWQESDRKYAAEIGADEYITKPFSPSHIIRRVQEIVKKKQEICHG